MIGHSPHLALFFLDLSDNPQLGDAGATLVGRALASNRTVKVVRMAGCAIGEAGGAAMLDAVRGGVCPLRRVGLERNPRLSGASLQARGPLALVPCVLRCWGAPAAQKCSWLLECSHLLLCPPQAIERELHDQAVARAIKLVGESAGPTVLVRTADVRGEHLPWLRNALLHRGHTQRESNSSPDPRGRGCPAQPTRGSAD